MSEQQSNKARPAEGDIVLARGVVEDVCNGFASIRWDTKYHDEYVDLVPVDAIRNECWTAEEIAKVNERASELEKLFGIRADEPRPGGGSRATMPGERRPADGSEGEVGMKDIICPTCEEAPRSLRGSLRAAILTEALAELAALRKVADAAGAWDKLFVWDEPFGGYNEAKALHEALAALPPKESAGCSDCGEDVAAGDSHVDMCPRTDERGNRMGAPLLRRREGVG